MFDIQKAPAQTAAVTYVAEQVFDSTRLDNDTQTDAEWFEANATYFLATSDFNIDGGLADSGFLLTDQFAEPLSRDGESRPSSITIAVTRISGDLSTKGQPVLVVQTSASATFNANDDSIVATFLSANPAITEDGLRAKYLDLFDGINESGFIAQGDFKYGSREEAPARSAACIARGPSTRLRATRS
jgi:hypothetical protein